MNIKIASVRGIRHAKHGEPREDFALASGNAFSVSDGISDSNCPRSSMGSKLACKIANEQLNGVVFDGKTVELLNAEGSPLLDHIAKSIVYGWVEAVNEHLAAHPFTDAELAGCRPSLREEYSRGIRPERAYACTLIAGVYDDEEKHLLLLQIGDGRAAVFTGGVPSYPIEPDPNCTGGSTSSLADSSPGIMRFKLIELGAEKAGGAAVFTDGVESGSTAETKAFVGSLFGLSEKEITAELNRRSAEVTGDDASVALISLPGREGDIIFEALVQSKRIDCESEVRYWTDKVYSIEAGGKLAHLKERVDRLAADSNTYESAFSDALRRYNDQGQMTSNRKIKKCLFRAAAFAFKAVRGNGSSKELEAARAEYEMHLSIYKNAKAELKSARERLACLS